MSAVAGIWRFDGGAAAEDLDRVQRAQAIYGPDRAGAWDGGDVALGVRLMRLLPEDRFDRQPLEGGEGRFVLVGDVRLDNRAELAGLLGLCADRLGLMADCDVLLAAWERWRDDVVHHLEGDFAFAVWDGAERRLFLARDPLGDRPLFLHRAERFFAFAGMPQGLRALLDVPNGPDLETIALFFIGAPERGPRSFHAGIERIEPGHFGVLTADRRWRTERYWRPEETPTLRLRDPRDYAEGLRAALLKTTRSHLRSVGPIGSHLSSGYDSSAVTAAAAQILAERGEQLTAFTHVPGAEYDGAAPRGRHGDEGPLAALTAALYPNVRHVRVPPGEMTVEALFERIFPLCGRPVLNPLGALWGCDVAAHARELGVRTMLTGAFGNYTISYAGMEAPSEHLRKGRLLAWAGLCLALRRNGGRRWLGLLASSLGPMAPPPVWTRLNRLIGRNIQDVAAGPLNPEYLRDPAFQAAIRRVGHDPSFRPLRDGAAARIKMTTQRDRGSILKGFLAAYRIDERDVTAGLPVLKFSLSVPTEIFCLNGRPRWLFRAAFGDWLPAEVLDAATKGLQSADWSQTLKRNGPYLAETFERAARSPSIAAIADPGRLSERSLDIASESLGLTNVSAIIRGAAMVDHIRRATGGNA